MTEYVATNAASSGIKIDKKRGIESHGMLCAANEIENCDRIEVGDEIYLPTEDELASGTVAAPAATPAATGM